MRLRVEEVKGASARVAGKDGTVVANGGRVGWLIHPLERAVTVFCPGDAPDSFVNPSTVQGTGPVAGLNW